MHPYVFDAQQKLWTNSSFKSLLSINIKYVRTKGATRVIYDFEATLFVDMVYLLKKLLEN